MAGARPARRGWGGALLALFGCVAVLGGIFAAGFFTGRHWPRVQVVVGLAKPNGGPGASHDSGSPAPQREAAAKPALGPTAEDAQRRLTFYEELTAPLGDPRRTSESARDTTASSATPAARKVSHSARAAAESTAQPDGPASAASALRVPPSEPRGGFTVQVAAYATRAQAEALRQRLAARGVEAQVSEVETARGPRHRVRVGRYATREEATAAANRLAEETKLGGFVAAR